MALNNTKGKSIAERPENVNNREEVGHWEIDLVVGKQGTKPVVLTLVDRKSRKSIYVLLKNKTQKEVIEALKRVAKRVGRDFSKVFKSITAYNGSEFLDSARIKEAAKCGEVYSIMRIHTAVGSAERTRTGIGCCGGSFPRERI